MAEIRNLSGEDLPRVAALLDELLPEWGGDREFLRATLLDHPWVDDELQSLVATDEAGELVGFIGAQARRLRFDGQPLRGVCCSHLVVRPDRRGGAAGALLLGRLLSGPQDLTWSDSANAIVARMWKTFGGQLDHARAVDWMLVLRPAGWVSAIVRARLRGGQVGRTQVPVGALPAHAALRGGATAEGPPASGRDARGDELCECAAAIERSFRLAVAHDTAYLEHLFAVIEGRSGELVRRVVSRGDRPVGWYAYLPLRDAAARVLHLAADRRSADAVLGDLLADARRRRVSVLAGRLEPHLDAPLRSHLPVLGFAREPVIHARDPELRAALASDAALLTQLDSEWFVP